MGSCGLAEFMDVLIKQQTYFSEEIDSLRDEKMGEVSI